VSEILTLLSKEDQEKKDSVRRQILEYAVLQLHRKRKKRQYYDSRSEYGMVEREWV